MNPTRLIAPFVCGLVSLCVAPAAQPALSIPAADCVTTRPGGDSPPSPVQDLLGSSCNLRALFGTASSWAERPELQPLLARVSRAAPGVHSLGLPAPDGDSVVVVTLERFAAIRGARGAAYRVGRWPTTGLAAHDPRYAAPPGFIPVTSENEATPVSKRFRLRDFLTHDQQDVWPKVLVLCPALLDKLELIGDELVAWGLPGKLHIMSGFRTPQYNALGVGRKGGRARDSRHMYGDAADVIVDADGDGVMDDLDGDGRITIRDARVLFGVAELIESRHPELVGGLSAYPANAAHGPFVHVDARGVRARW